MANDFGASIDENGITVPDYAAVLARLTEKMRGIYGQDIYLDPDSQDGQMLGIFALATSDAYAMAVATYNSFSPSTAQGAGLASVVKINGLAKLTAAFSSVDLTLTGDVGTTIAAGVASDAAGNRWRLPAGTVIGPGTTVTVTATASVPGAITAAPGTITKISTPVAGWATVTNSGSAVPGRAIESDAALRKRQTLSTALPALTVLDAIMAAVAQLPGVTRYARIENDTAATDGNGVPEHSIALVVEGGVAADIAAVIAQRKTPGTGTFGSTAVTVADAYGIPRTIRFSRPDIVDIDVVIEIKALVGYTSPIGASIKAAVAAYINALPIGEDVLFTRLYVPASLCGPSANPALPTDQLTYEILSIEICISGGSPAASDVVIAFDEAAACAVADITLTVT